MTGHAARDMAERLFNPLAGHLNRRKIITVVAWWVFAVLLVGYLRRIWAQRRRGGGEVVRGGGDARELGEGGDGGELYITLFVAMFCFISYASSDGVQYCSVICREQGFSLADFLQITGPWGQENDKPVLNVAIQYFISMLFCEMYI